MACPTCETVIDISAAPFEEWDDDILGDVSDISDSGCVHAHSFRDACNFDQPLDAFPHLQLGLKKESSQTSTRFGLAHETPDGGIMFDNTSSTAMELVLRSDFPDHPGRAVLPNPQWIDLDVIRNWISLCKTRHQDRCHEPPWLKGVEPAEPEFLIDVVDSCIVTSPSKGTSYVALSYTWGLGRNLKNTKATTHDLRKPGALNLPHFASQLPETIQNTMDLVKCLGERYLWVDALCIIQDDPKSLSQNLNQMQLLYANSTFNIMASAGRGAEFGLRGIRDVSKPRNLQMRVYPLANGENLCAKPLPLDPTSGDKYSYHRRGWTFQEWLFSRRRLVFTDRLLEWECQCAHWQEHMISDPQVDNSWASRPRGHELKLTPSPTIWDFLPVVSMFNTRALTIAEDAPRAFAGIQAMLHRVHPGGLLFGLSEFFFEVFLSWSSLYADVERRGSDPNAILKEGLPSWSWLGWQGDITFPYDNEFRLTRPWHYHEQKVGFREPVTEWFCADSPNSKIKRRVRSEWHKYKLWSLSRPNPELLLKGWSKQLYNQESEPHDFVPSGGAKHLYIYNHETDVQQRLRYPVPVLDWADTPTLNEQMQYLSCTTSRARCVMTPEIQAFTTNDYPRRIHIQDENKNIVVSLTLPNAKSAAAFVDPVSRPGSIELVAFAKGWSTWLGNDVVRQSQEKDDSSKDDDGSSVIVPGTDARDCYFVLWVEIVNNVSYRLATGEASETWWEMHKEVTLSEVVFG